MIEQEQSIIEAKLAQAQTVVEGIETVGFSQKGLLRLDQDVSDRVQAAQFLDNYARVGLLKERLLERALPNFRLQLEQTDQVIGQEQVPAMSKLAFLNPNEVELDGTKIVLSEKQAGILRFLARNIGEQVKSGQVSLEALNNPNTAASRFRVRVAELKEKLNQEGKPEIIVSSGKKAQASWVMLQGVVVVWPEEQPITKGEEEILIGEAVPTKHKLAFLKDNQVELDGRRIKFSPKEFKVLEVWSRHLDEEVLGRNLSQEALNNPDPKKVGLNPIIQSIKQKINQPEIFDSKKAATRSWFKLKNVEVVWLQEEVQVTSEPEATPTEPVALPPMLHPDSEVLVIPYKPTEDEKRSGEETKMLGFVVDALSRNKNITFEGLQKAVSPESRIRTVSGKRQLMIYQGSELKEMFNTVLTKFREEAAIPNLREAWSDEELQLWSNLQLVIRSTSGNDIASFIKAVRARIDSAERAFYNSLPEEERQRRIFWIDL